MGYTKINEKELRRLHEDGKSDYEIAQELTDQGTKVSHSGVSRARQRLNLPPNFSCRCNTDEQRAMSPREKYERFLEYGRNYERDPERTREVRKAWYEKNKERLSAMRKLWREAREIVKTKVEVKTGKKNPLLKRLWDAGKHILSKVIPKPVQNTLNTIKEKIAKLRIFRFKKES